MSLTEKLGQPESKVLEFKQDLSSPEKILKTIVAFANTAGGSVVIGVEDKTKSIIGVADPLLQEESIANLVSDSILPRLVPDIEIHSWRNVQVIEIRVYPSPTRPHYLKSIGIEKGTFVRVGSTNRLADISLRAELGRYVRNQSFDEELMPDLNASSINIREVSRCFEGIRSIKPSDLKTLRILTEYQGRDVPTIGGYLLFGTDREKYFSDAWIQMGVFSSVDKTRLIQMADVRDYLIPGIEAAVDFVSKNTTREVKIGRIYRTEVPEYPTIAIREAIINSLVHADYSKQGAPIRIALFNDRLEIENPGLLPFGLTLEEIQQGTSRLRNKVIGKIFYALGLIEQWGSGIQKIISACKEAGLRSPVFEELGDSFRVTIYREKVKKGQFELHSTDRDILNFLSDKKGLRPKEIASRLGLSPRTVRNHLRSLKERGLVIEVSASPKDPQKLYFRC